MAITFWYKNYRGEEGYRRATPISLRFGSSEWHPAQQWLMLAHDDEKNAPREFALADMKDIIGRVEIPFAQPPATPA